MPEMPNVVTDEVVESEWGNDIRDRTIQRYANAAERTTLHAAPVAGDLSFLADTGKIYVYYSGSWRTMYDDLAGTVAGYVKMDTASEHAVVTATTTWQSGASITFTKPGAWAGYNIYVWGMIVFRTQYPAPGTGPLPEAKTRVVIDGVAGSEVDSVGADISTVFTPLTVPANHQRGPLTANANCVIQFTRTDPTVQKQASSVQLMAIRTS